MSLSRSYAELLRRTLLNTPTLTAYVGDRIWTAQIAEIASQNPAPTLEYPIVSFSMDTPSRDLDVPDVVYLSFRIWTWSKNSHEEASNIYDTIYAVLHRLRIADTTLQAVQNEIAGPTSYMDPEAQTYATVSRWDARVIHK